MTERTEFWLDENVSPKAVEVAGKLATLAREHHGTFTFDYGLERIVVTRDTEVGIGVHFLTSNPRRKPS